MKAGFFIYIIVISLIICSCTTNDIYVPKEILNANVYLGQDLSNLKKELNVKYDNSIDAYYYKDNTNLSYYSTIAFYIKFGKIDKIVLANVSINGMYNEDIEFVREVLIKYFGEYNKSYINYIERYNLKQNIIEWTEKPKIKYSYITLVFK